MKIKLDFELQKMKYISQVGLRDGSYYDLIFDPGSNMTTMSKKLFDTLKFPLRDAASVTISGLNDKGKGISTVIDYFEIGDVNIGSVRVVLGSVLPEFENSIILGVNVLMWFEYSVSHRKNEIELVERKVKNAKYLSKPVTKENRFVLKNPEILTNLFTVSELSDDEPEDDLLLSVEQQQAIVGLSKAELNVLRFASITGYMTYIKADDRFTINAGITKDSCDILVDKGFLRYSVNELGYTYYVTPKAPKFEVVN